MISRDIITGIHSYGRYDVFASMLSAKIIVLGVPHDWSIEGENLKDNPGGGRRQLYYVMLGCQQQL